eukprot:10262295-Ditylum_brightwellii.AAC.1
MSGAIFIQNGGPISWTCQRQDHTALSTCQAEVVATSECSKELTHLRNVLEDLSLHGVKTSTTLFNDNRECIDWCKNSTTKGMKYLNINEDLKVTHIEGKVNPNDMFTKEDKDVSHYLGLRNLLVVMP